MTEHSAFRKESQRLRHTIVDRIGNRARDPFRSYVALGVAGSRTASLEDGVERARDVGDKCCRGPGIDGEPTTRKFGLASGREVKNGATPDALGTLDRLCRNSSAVIFATSARTFSGFLLLAISTILLRNRVSEQRTKEGQRPHPCRMPPVAQRAKRPRSPIPLFGRGYQATAPSLKLEAPKASAFGLSETATQLAQLLDAPNEHRNGGRGVGHHGEGKGTQGPLQQQALLKQACSCQGENPNCYKCGGWGYLDPIGEGRASAGPAGSPGASRSRAAKPKGPERMFVPGPRTIVSSKARPILSVQACPTCGRLVRSILAKHKREQHSAKKAVRRTNAGTSRTRTQLSDTALAPQAACLEGDATDQRQNLDKNATKTEFAGRTSLVSAVRVPAETGAYEAAHQESP